MSHVTVKASDPETQARAEALADFVGWTSTEALTFLLLAESTPTLGDVARFRHLVWELHRALDAFPEDLDQLITPIPAKGA